MAKLVINRGMPGGQGKGGWHAYHPKTGAHLGGPYHTKGQAKDNHFDVRGVK